MVSQYPGKYTGGFNEDCFESMVISKDVEEVNLSVEKSILQVGGVLCHWNIIVSYQFKIWGKIMSSRATKFLYNCVMIRKERDED